MENKSSAPMYPEIPQQGYPPQPGFAPPQQGYPQPPPSYTPQAPMVGQPQVTVATMNVVPLGPSPANLVCPACHATVSTRIMSEASSRTHIAAAILCILGCWCCVCVPYCMESCQNANHYCPSCNAYLGSYRS